MPTDPRPTSRHKILLDADVGIEAINHGADAVYIGGPSFGARDKVPNSVADIERLARHAHRFGARIFVTLNTILRDDELEEARRIVESTSYRLIEALAEAIAQEILLSTSAERVTVRVRKPRAPLPGRFDWAGVEIERERSGR